MEEQKHQELTFIKVIQFLTRWRYTILIISLLAGIAGYVFSSPYFVTPLYKSEATFYAGTSNTITRMLMERSDLPREDLLEFGDEEHAERMLQILESKQLMNEITDRFDLMVHYDIDPDGRYPRTKLEDVFYSRFSFSRTPYASVVIQVKDADPDLAAEMANTAMYMVDTMKNNIQKPRATDAKNIVREQYENKKAEVFALIDSLRSISERGGTFKGTSSQMKFSQEQLFSVLSQIESDFRNEPQIVPAHNNNYSHRNYSSSLLPFMLQASTIPGKNDPSTMGESWLIGQYGPAFYATARSLALETESLSYLRERLEHATINAEFGISNLYIIDEASPSERHASPVRSLAVLGSLISAFLMTCIILLIGENIRNIRTFIRESATN